MRFKWLERDVGTRVAINPQQVLYVQPKPNGGCTVVLGAVTGGLHEIHHAKSAEAVVAYLEGEDEALAQAPARHRARPKASKAA